MTSNQVGGLKDQKIEKMKTKQPSKEKPRISIQDIGGCDLWRIIYEKREDNFSIYLYLDTEQMLELKRAMRKVKKKPR